MTQAKSALRLEASLKAEAEPWVGLYPAVRGCLKDAARGGRLAPHGYLDLACSLRAEPGHVCLKQRLALSQKSFWRTSGVMLDQSMILSIESGNQLS